MARHDHFTLPIDLVSSESNEIHLRVSVLLQPNDLPVSSISSIDSDLHVEPTRADLLEIASRIYFGRRLREKTMSIDIFGEPAWDMLLALYCYGAKGENLSVTSLSHAANAPMTTGLRWQRALIEQQLIERDDDRKDGRRHFLKLTPKAIELLENYLTRLFHCDKLGTPPL